MRYFNIQRPFTGRNGGGGATATVEGGSGGGGAEFHNPLMHEQ